MGKAKLEVLGLEVPTGLFAKYHDDGVVDSLEEHSLGLIDKYFTSRTAKGKYQTGKIKRFFEYMAKLGGCVDGITISITPSFREHIHIFYLDRFSPEFAIKTRAHEETHALENLGRLDMLAEKILREQKVKIDFREISNRSRGLLGETAKREVKADIGATYALLTRSINPSLVHPTGATFELARDLYEQSRLGE